MAKSKKLDPLTYQRALRLAFDAARQATEKYLIDHPNDWYPCGFSWVIFDGRDPIVNVLKTMFSGDPSRMGSKGWPKGWHIWNPSGHSTQCMEAKVAGSRAFVEVLKKYEIECDHDARMD